MIIALALKIEKKRLSAKKKSIKALRAAGTAYLAENRSRQSKVGSWQYTEHSVEQEDERNREATSRRTRTLVIESHIAQLEASISALNIQTQQSKSAEQKLQSEIDDTSRLLHREKVEAELRQLDRLRRQEKRRQ
jgi:hypothetical protein